MDLGTVTTGRHLRVVDIDLDDRSRVRLRELGLRPGADVHVTHRGAFGALVVAVGADRFALDAGTAAAVRVETAPAAAHHPVTVGAR